MGAKRDAVELWNALQAGEAIIPGFEDKALRLAARAGHVELLRHALAVGANIDAQDADGNAALHHAVMGRSVSAVQELVRRGASSRPNPGGHSPSAAIIRDGTKGAKPVIQALCDLGAYVAPEAFAAVGLLREAQTALEGGVEISVDEFVFQAAAATYAFGTVKGKDGSWGWDAATIRDLESVMQALESRGLRMEGVTSKAFLRLVQNPSALSLEIALRLGCKTEPLGDLLSHMKHRDVVEPVLKKYGVIV